jgi:ketosteroid isomerase-like protein
VPELVEIVRTTYAAIGRGDIESVVAVCDPAIACNVPVGSVAGQIYHGHEGIRGFFADLDEAWERFEPEPESVEVDGDHVLALGNTRVLGRGSGIEIDFEWGHLIEFREEKVIRLMGYLRHDQAREAFHEHARS